MALLPLPAAIGAAAETAEARLAPAVAARATDTSHTLFMGVDLSVARDNQFYPVRDVSGGSFVIDVKGQPVFIPMNSMLGAPISLRVDQNLKISKVSASIAKLKGERAYTPGNDPARIMADQQNATQQELLDQREKAAVTVMNAESGATLGIATKPTLDARNPAVWAKDRAAGAAMPTDMALNLARESGRRADMTMNGLSDTFGKRLSDELALELYDAMRVEFDVTSNAPLNNPFVVLITRYHERDAKPGHVQNWIYAKSLDPIGSESQKVRVLQGGFPRGYVLEDYQVHLFNLGREVASDVAPKRVPLTATDALTYLSIEYLSAHKQDTVPASVALTTLPVDFQSNLRPGAAKELMFVKVAVDGHIIDAYKDEECSDAIQDPQFRTLLKQIRYLPALEKGKPIESVVRLKLSDLPRDI